jgi:dihydrofolate reductase
MRQLVLQMSMSLDGYVLGPDGKHDWVFPGFDDEIGKWNLDTLERAGVHAMGSHTYKEMAAVWPTSDSPIATPMNDKPKVVFSRTPIDTPWGEVTVASGDLADEVARLKSQDGKEILAHGGARFAQALSSAGLVDEYRLRVHPIALGAGTPLFVDKRPLALTEARAYPRGVVVHEYRPA